jgi:S1-C subfamily serine protease
MWFVRSGTRVTGPFTEDELKAMRRRGEFAPTNQVSLDRIRWESAAQLVIALDGNLPEWRKRAPAVAESSSGSGFQPAVSTAEWYYVGPDRQQKGPVPEAALGEMLHTRQLPGSTLACKAGETRWDRVTRQPDLLRFVPSGSPRILAIAIPSTLLLGLLACIVLLTARKPGDGPDRNPSDPARSDTLFGAGSSLLISSPKDKRRSDAVGLVVCCERWKFPDGKIIEVPNAQEGYSSGTAFAVTADGYMLTNRHVIEDRKPPSKKVLEKDNTRIIVDSDYPIYVFMNEIKIEAALVHTSARYDLAILKINRTKPHPFFSLDTRNEFDDIDVAAIGFPGRASDPRTKEEEELFNRRITKNTKLEEIMLPRSFMVSVTHGQISRVALDNDRVFVIEHGAKIFHGNSGGPLVADGGQVVGINTWGFSAQSDTLYAAQSTGQLRKEIEEFIPNGLAWKSR